MNLVWRTPYGSSLYQGDKRDAASALKSSSPPFVVLAAEEIQPEAPPGTDGLRLALYDRILYGHAETEAVTKVALAAARECAGALRRGVSVLTTCNAGMNRSGLVTGLCLRLLGVGPEEAVELVRLARGPLALSNPSFAEIVRSNGVAREPKAERRSS